MGHLREGWKVGNRPPHTVGSLSGNPAYAEPATYRDPSLWPIWPGMWVWGQGIR